MMYSVDTELHVLCGFLSILSVVGASGNIVILLVYVKRKDQRATNAFIKALAALDFCVSVLVMPYTIVYEYKLVTSVIACKVFELMRHFNVAMSNFTLVAVATERFMAICRPTITVTASHVQKGLLVMVVVGVLFSIPSFWIFAVVPSTSVLSSYNGSVTVNTTSRVIPGRAYCTFTESVLGSSSARGYQGFQMVVWFTTISAIIVLYAFVYRRVWKRDKAKNQARVRPTAWVVSVNEAENPPEHSTTLQKARHNKLRIGPLQESKVNISNQPDVSEISQVTEFSQTTSTSQNPTVYLNRRTDSRINAHRKTGTMLFLCTVIYIVFYIPFWLDIFGVTDSIVFRHMFFISNASNPVIYGIVNRQVRKAMSAIICRQKARIP